MSIPASYHNHTRWSDGADTLDAYLAVARSMGIDELGVSDHFTVAPHGAVPGWSMPLDRLDEYVSEIQSAAKSVEAVTLRLGVEADFFPETAEELRAWLAAYPFDYIIGSVHFIGQFPIDADANDWKMLPIAERDEVWRQYWRRIAQLAESRVFDIVAHLDLPKKFGYRPSVDLTAEAEAALDAIAAAGMAIEINTAGWDRPAREAYPSPDLLRSANRRGIPILMSADAHAAAQLTRHFAQAQQVARDAGYTEVVRYAGRRRTAASGR